MCSPATPRGNAIARATGRSVTGRPSTRDVQPARDAPRVHRGIDALLPRLVGRDLGEVEDVADVELVPGHLDAREAVDREVAERVSRRGRGCEKRRGGDEDDEQLLHDESSLPGDGRPQDREVRVDRERAPVVRCGPPRGGRGTRRRSRGGRSSVRPSCRGEARASSTAAPRRSDRRARAPSPGRRRRRCSAARA